MTQPIEASISSVESVVQVTAAMGSAGQALTPTASSSVRLSRGYTGGPIEYKVGSAGWVQLDRNEGIDLPVNLSATVIMVRKASTTTAAIRLHLKVNTVGGVSPVPGVPLPLGSSTAAAKTLAWRTDKFLFGTEPAGANEAGRPVSASTNVTGSISGNTFTVTAAGIDLAVGMVLYPRVGNPAIIEGTYITAAVTGTGRAGTYTLSGPPQTVASATYELFATARTAGTPADGIYTLPVAAYLCCGVAVKIVSGTTRINFDFNNGGLDRGGDSFTAELWGEYRPPGIGPLVTGLPTGAFMFPITVNGSRSMVVPASGNLWEATATCVDARFQPGGVVICRVLAHNNGNPWRLAYYTGPAQGAASGPGITPFLDRNSSGYPGSCFATNDPNQLYIPWGTAGSGWQNTFGANQNGAFNFVSAWTDIAPVNRMFALDGHGDSLLFSQSFVSWFEKYFTPLGVPNKNYGAPGTNVSQIPRYFFMRPRNAKGDVTWCNHGRNQALTPTSLIAACRIFRQMGYRKIIWSTTTSVTNAANVVQDSSVASNAVLMQVYNDKVTYPDGPDLVIDIAKYVQNSSGQWLDMAYTTDYTHYAELGNETIKIGMTADNVLAQILALALV